MNDRAIIAVVIAGIALVAGVVVAVVLLVRRYERKRSEAFAAVARENNMAFSAEQDEALFGRMQRFDLFNQGRSRKMKNVIGGTSDVANIYVFDYQYTTGGGDSSTTHTHSVVAVDSDALMIPRFTLRPENFLDNIGAMLGLQDIDFDENPAFSNAFVLKGEDEDAIRDLFDRTLLEFFAQRKGIYVEAAHGTFIYYKGNRKKPAEIREYMKEGFDVYAVLTERLKRS